LKQSKSLLDLRALLERVLPDNNPFYELEIEQDFPGVGYGVLLLSGRQLDVFPLILLAGWPRSLTPQATLSFQRRSMERLPVGIPAQKEFIGTLLTR
jgi:hypothetical protein